MNVEPLIEDALEALVARRVYPDVAPTGVAKPYIVYQEISGEAPVFLEQASPSKKNGRFQIVVWAATRLEASAISLEIESAMVMATAFQAKPIGGRTAAYDEDTRLRGTRQDFTVWSDR